MSIKMKTLEIDNSQLIEMTKQLIHRFHVLNDTADLMDTQNRKELTAIQPLVFSLCSYIVNFRGGAGHKDLILTKTDELNKIDLAQMMDIFERLGDRLSVAEDDEKKALTEIIGGMKTFVYALLAKQAKIGNF